MILRTMNLPTAAFCVLLGAAVAADPGEDLARLEIEMEAALDEYFEGLRSVAARFDDSNSRSSSANPADGTPDPRVEVLRKIDALAAATEGTPEGLEIARRAFYWSGALRLDESNLYVRFARITKQVGSDSRVEDDFILVPEVYKSSGSPSDWVEGLERISRTVSSNELKAAALLAGAQIHMSERSFPSAREWFDRVFRISGDSDDGRLAQAYIHEIDHLQVGMVAPDFSVKLLDGPEVKLSSLRGKVVLLDFWATWCPPCMAEIPALRAANLEFKDRPFVILGISLDDLREMLSAVIMQQEVPGLQAWDESARENPVGLLYNAQVLPTWFLIDQRGIIRERDPFGERLIPAIAALLNEEPSSDRTTPRAAPREKPPPSGNP